MVCIWLVCVICARIGNGQIVNRALQKHKH